jgi:hypothetical protein
VFENIGYFLNFGTVVCKSGSFRIVFVFFVACLMVCSIALQLVFEIGYQFVGKVIVAFNI